MKTSFLLGASGAKTAVNDDEIDALASVLRSQLRDATKGLYAENKWARSIEVEILIVDEWRKSRQSHTFNASDLDGPVWSIPQMQGLSNNP